MVLVEHYITIIATMLLAFFQLIAFGWFYGNISNAGVLIMNDSAIFLLYFRRRIKFGAINSTEDIHESWMLYAFLMVPPRSGCHNGKAVKIIAALA